MSDKKLFHEQVADKLIAQLEAGVAPWQKPWTPGESNSSLPVNATTGKRYHGANVLQLMAQGYDDPRWCTYRQAAAAGAQVRAGERGTTVQYFKFTEEQTKRDEQGRPVLDGEGKPVKEEVRLERPRCFHSSVFNAQQIDGLKPLPPLAPPSDQQWSPIERAEHILAASGAQIKHGQQDRAFYRPGTDTIHLPEQSQFPEASGYYATALHELGHWTGHESRLDRPLNNPFGSEGYAKEELRAEIASMIVGETIGIGHDPADHAAYVGHWIKSLRDDPMEIVRAAGDAEKMSNFVMAFEQQQVQAQEPVQEEQPKVLIAEVPAQQIVLMNDAGGYFTGLQIEPWTDDARDARVYQDPAQAQAAADLLRKRADPLLNGPAIELHVRDPENPHITVPLSAPISDPQRPAQEPAQVPRDERQIVLGTDSGNYYTGASIEPWTDDARDAQVYADPSEAWRAALALQVQQAEYLEDTAVQLQIRHENNPSWAVMAVSLADANNLPKLAAQWQASFNEPLPNDLARTQQTENSEQAQFEPNGWVTVAEEPTGKWSWSYMDSNGVQVASGEGYESEDAARTDGEKELTAQTAPEQPGDQTSTTAVQDPPREQQGREEKTYIKVPYKQKDEAKALGAKWDRGEQSWYVPPGGDLSKFEKWPTVPGVAATPAVAAELVPLATQAPTPAHMLRLSEFMDQATATRLENHGRKWEVTHADSGDHAFSDADTAEDAKRDVHAAIVNNALYSNSAENRSMGIPAETMPPDAVIDDHPGMREKWADVCGPKEATTRVQDAAGVGTATPESAQAVSERQYLAVPYEERGPAKAAGAKWDAGAKSWYVGPNADMEKLERWNPERVKAQQDPAIPPREEFAEALRQIGCVVSGEHPIMDGSKHRITVVGEAHSDKAGSGFYVGHLDGHPAGYMKNNKSGVEMKWKSAGQVMDPEARAALAAAAATKLQERAAEQAETHESTAQRLATQLRSLQPVTVQTPYMQSKGIDPQPGVYTDKSGRGTCIPVMDANGKQWSTQYIQEDGTKRFAKDSKKEGCFHVVGGDLAALERAPAIVIGEGYATAATLTAALGFPAVAAFDAGNLPAVAQALHEKLPGKPIILAADDDLDQERTRGRNPGREKAEQAAKAVGGHVLLPIFAAGEQEGNPKAFSDFNDMANNSVLGIEGVQRQVRTTVDAVLEREHARTQEREQVQQQEQKPVSKRVAKIG